MNKNRQRTAETGSANVYADLGYRDPEAMLVKARLANRISQVIQRQHLTQTDAARRMGMTQPKLSNLLRGRFSGISEERMMRCLTALGQDVQIVVRSPRRARQTGSLSVHLA